ncbi:MAG: hypothetical protein O3B03_07565 [Proteobacteria bacterium]|nr:hypothetical protein [Pseudomonadota bacterium]
MSYYDPDPIPDHFTHHYPKPLGVLSRGMDEPSNGSRRTGRPRKRSYTCSGCDWIGTECIGTGDDKECPECGEKVEYRMEIGAKMSLWNLILLLLICAILVVLIFG